MRVLGLFAVGLGGGSAGYFISMWVVFTLNRTIDFSPLAIVFITLFGIVAAGVSIVASALAVLARRKTWLALTLGGGAALVAGVLIWNQPWVLYPYVLAVPVAIGWVVATGLFLRATDQRAPGAATSAAQPGMTA